MIRVENIEVFNFEGAIRGCRNPMNSHAKSDSKYCQELFCDDCRMYVDGVGCKRPKHMHDGNDYIVGKNDLDLMRRLYKAGTEHRKYLRQIIVSMDITAPMYWFSEYDTYKVGTVANSTSKMHKIHAKPIELSDFSTEEFDIDDEGISMNDCFYNVIADCEMLRRKFVETGEKKYWRGLIQLLPESYNQTRTVTINYENVVTIIKQRSGHKLSEWTEFVGILKDLPYIKEIIEE